MTVLDCSGFVVSVLSMHTCQCGIRCLTQRWLSGYLCLQVGNFMSSSLTPLHFEDKLVFIGDSAHTMYAPSQTTAA